MELGGKGNAITSSTTTISTKTIEVKSDPALAPFPIKREHQKQKTRVDQAAKYKECLKNHAASKGGHVVDGCCEFMSGSEEELKCAACNCHRSFHRKEMYGDRKSNQELINPTFNCSNNSYKVMQRREIGHRTSSSSEDMKKILIHRNNVGGKGMIRKKKRVRTKIDDEQKEKMKEFAERLGWRMQKKDDEEIDKFCRTVNLRRQVFKVWMHNNKQAIKRMHNNTNDLQN